MGGGSGRGSGGGLTKQKRGVVTADAAELDVTSTCDAQNRVLAEQVASLTRDNQELRARLAAASATSDERPLACAGNHGNWDEVEMLLRSLQLEKEIAAVLPMACDTGGKQLGRILSMTEDEVNAAVEKAVLPMAQRINNAIKKCKEAAEDDPAAQQSRFVSYKFTNPLTGGNVDEYYEGVTGLVGEPHPDLEKGMQIEHMQSQDSTIAFTTGNYGLTTNPATEFQLVRGGGEGLKTDKDGETELVIVTTTRGPWVGGQIQEDRRVLRPMSDYGDWDKDGLLKSRAPLESDSPLKVLIKKAGLRRVEVWALVLYTGPMFMIYNAILRGFGTCGQVLPEVEFQSAEFWEQLKSVHVSDRMKEANHLYSSTIHCLASAIKKLQRISKLAQGSRLYRGLGGLDCSEFLESIGFTEKAFMSTTDSLQVAIDYSGVQQKHVRDYASVLAIDIAEVDKGADIGPFSQYPKETETVWNACSYIQNLRGRQEMIATEWGPVLVLNVRANANSRMMTIEELEERRKKIAVSMFQAIHTDVCLELDANVKTPQFERRVAQDIVGEQYMEQFIASIRDGSAQKVALCQKLPASRFNDNAFFSEMIKKGLNIATLARSKFQSWLEDSSETLWSAAKLTDFEHAQMILSQFRWHTMQTACTSSIDTASVRQRKLDYCAARGWVRDLNPSSLEAVDEETGNTPVITKCKEGDVHAVKLLLEAGADPSANNSAALYYAARQGRDDISNLLLNHGDVDVNAQYGPELMTPANSASYFGHCSVLLLLIQAKADLNIHNRDGFGCLHLASYTGQSKALSVLIEARANIDQWHEIASTPIQVATLWGQSETLKMLIEAKASIDSRCSSALWGGESLTPLEVAKKNSLGKSQDSMNAVIEILNAHSAA